MALVADDRMHALQALFTVKQRPLADPVANVIGAGVTAARESSPTGIIGARRAWTALMISARSIPGR